MRDKNMTNKLKIADIVDSEGQPIHPKNITKKPAVFFTACDSKQFYTTIPFWKTMVKFHSPKEVDMILYTDEKDPEKLKQIPEGIKIEDLTPYFEDPMFWYRQKPILMEPLLDEYELVVGFDSDQLVIGDLSYLLNTYDFDVATVINWNRHDPQFYGVVDIARLGIAPVEYFNCGLVALRSRKFAHIWKVNCFTKQFDYMQYREQDVLNIMCYFGNWNVRCLDHPDILAEIKNHGWWGIIGKGEWSRAELRGKDIVVPMGLGDQPYPPGDMVIKIAHLGGGHGSIKDNWENYFPEEVMERINELRT